MDPDSEHSEPAKPPLRFSPYRFLALRLSVALLGLVCVVFLPRTADATPAMEALWEGLPHFVRGGARLLCIAFALLVGSGWSLRPAALGLVVGLAGFAGYDRIDGLLAANAAALALLVALHPRVDALRLGALGEPQPARGTWLAVWTYAAQALFVVFVLAALLGLAQAFSLTRVLLLFWSLGSFALGAFDERWLPPKGDLGGIVYFDGVCVFCQGSVRLIMTEEARGTLRFAQLDGDTARQSLAGVATRPSGSIVFSVADKVYVASDAALRIARAMGGFWRLFWVFRFLPLALRDRAYDWFASNRYRWFGRTESCFVPSAEQRPRFLP